MMLAERSSAIAILLFATAVGAIGDASAQTMRARTIRMSRTGKTLDPTSTARNAVFYGDKAIDRSPCGTGTSARMAQWYAQGKLKMGDEFVHESIIGSKFIGRIEEETTLDGKKAIVPSIEGWAIIHGFNHIILDDEDPYVHGFQVI